MGRMITIVVKTNLLTGYDAEYFFSIYQEKTTKLWIMVVESLCGNYMIHAPVMEGSNA